jgi:hydrogenase expression/formation protein HypC
VGVRGERIRYMCLAVPVLIKSIKDQNAEVELGGVTLRISIAITPDVKVGDYVLIHTGYAISVIDEADALETIKMLESLLKEDEVYR